VCRFVLSLIKIQIIRGIFLKANIFLNDYLVWVARLSKNCADLGLN
jgi:hypothetical protein